MTETQAQAHPIWCNDPNCTGQDCSEAPDYVGEDDDALLIGVARGRRDGVNVYVIDIPGRRSGLDAEVILTPAEYEYLVQLLVYTRHS
jgi:hypothetical protein